MKSHPAPFLAEAKESSLVPPARPCKTPRVIPPTSQKFWPGLSNHRNLRCGWRALFVSLGLALAATATEPATLTLTGAWQIRVSAPNAKGRPTTATLDVPPPALLTVKAEPLAALPIFNPKVAGWVKGATLSAVRAQECTTPHLLDPESLELRSGPAADAPRLTRGTDYEVDPAWASLGRLTNGGLTEGQPVFATYRHALLRLDSIVLTRAGRIVLRSGEAKPAAPVPPALAEGERRLANVYLPGRIPKLAPAYLFPVLETSFPEPPRESPAATEKFTPHTMAKLRSGQPLRILAWGDSVTVGSFVPDWEHQRWQEQFVTRLRVRFPKAQIELVTEAWGGRNTDSYLAEPPGSEHNYAEKVLARKPDLIVSEFVNDAWMSEAQVGQNYGKLLADFKAIGAEWIILSPHYVRPDWMGLTQEREIDDDPRPYVKGLRPFTAKNQLALADASLRYGRLWRQGIPYSTLMLNSINHPDARGMSLFADSLMALFPEPSAQADSLRPMVQLVAGGESPMRAEDCRATLVGPGVNQPDPFPGYGGFVGWESPIRLKNGDWLVGFNAGYWHASAPTPLRYPVKTLEEYKKMGLPADIVAPTGGRAMIMRSTDAGKTWSKPVTLIDTPADDRHPAFVELRDGTLLCSIFTYSGEPEGGDWGKDSPLAVRVHFVRSFDGGRTWEKKSRQLQTPFSYDETDGPLVRLKDGSVLVAVNGRASTGPPDQAAVLRSTNRGKSWKLLATVKAAHELQEVTVAELPDGQMVMMARPEGDISWSRDHGHTWTPPVTFGFRMFAPSLYVLRDGTLVCLHGSYAPGHGGLRVILSNDGGHTWIAPAKDHGFLVDNSYGYGKAMELPDGSLFITYLNSGGHRTQDAQSNSIRCLRLRVRPDHSGVDLLPAPNR